jgi:hypothetical protein
MKSERRVGTARLIRRCRARAGRSECLADEEDSGHTRRGLRRAAQGIERQSSAYESYSDGFKQRT